MYLLPTAGFSVNLHYCDGDFAGVFVEGIPPSCGCETEDDGCCDNKYFYFKDNTDQQKTEQQSSNKISFSAAVFSLYSISEFSNYKFSGSTKLYNQFEPPKLRRHVLLSRFNN